MEIKQYIHRGILAQNQKYETVLEFNGLATDKIIVVLEGRLRRKTQLKQNRWLYENYYPISFIGLEDYLLGRSRKGIVGSYPGSHYCIWEADDFYNSIMIYPVLARRAILELSRHIRLYDAQKQENKENIDMRKELAGIDLDNAEDDFCDLLFLNYSEDESFPPELIQKISRTFKPGDYLIREGEKTFEIYIIHSGYVDVIQRSDSGSKVIDTLKAGEMIGEMAQFDGLPRSADVVAKEETQALVFLPENFSLLFQLHPSWSVKLLNILAQRLEQRRKFFEDIDLKK